MPLFMRNLERNSVYFVHVHIKNSIAFYNIQQNGLHAENDKTLNKRQEKSGKLLVYKYRHLVDSR